MAHTSSSCHLHVGPMRLSLSLHAWHSSSSRRRTGAARPSLLPSTEGGWPREAAGMDSWPHFAPVGGEVGAAGGQSWARQWRTVRGGLGPLGNSGDGIGRARLLACSTEGGESIGELGWSVGGVGGANLAAPERWPCRPCEAAGGAVARGRQSIMVGGKRTEVRVLEQSLGAYL